MNELLLIVALGAGLIVGALAVWFILKAKAARAAAEARAELQPQVATLTERVNAKDQQIAQLQSALAAEEDHKTQLAMQLQQESNASASAGEKSRQLEEQLRARGEQLKEAQAALETERQQLAGARNDLATVTAQLEAGQKAQTQLAREYADARTQLDQLQADLLAQRRQNGELTEKIKYLDERLGTQRQDIEGIQQKFQKDFEAVANKLLVENSSRFGQQSAESLDKLLGPLRENLKDFKLKLDTTQQETATHSALLKDQISRIGTEAANLSKALKGDVKVLGNWGENMLDQILDRSGLQLGLHYRRQSSARDEAGDQRFLDVVIELPDARPLVIDSKVSLKAYEDYVNCPDEAARSRHLEAHIDCIRNHFRGLGAKGYHEIHGISAPDFVLMYVPIEAAFFVAVGQEPGLFSEALEKNVVLITNSSLLATLRTVAHVWRLADQQKNALEIADRGGKLYDKFVGFVGDLQGIGVALDNARKVWDEASKKLHSGTGNLVGQVEKLRALGVKAAKKLLARHTDETEDEKITPLITDGNGQPESGAATGQTPAPPSDA
jgi:DNA recombination protein RmuC